MEISQGYSLCSYPKQTKMSFFSFTKLEYMGAEQVLPAGLVLVGVEEKVGNGCGRVTIV
jgi:hypothetical protein